MRQSVIVHLLDDDPVIGELDELPKASDQFMIVHNPRRRDGKKVAYLNEDVTTVLFPWHRIEIVQVLPVADIENVIGFVRE